MSLFRKKNDGGIMDVIRCDEPDYLIWKWHPTGSVNSRKENAIRLGSSLRVKDGSVAVFVYKQKNGIYQDFIEGPFDEFINTKNLPILSSFIGLFYDGKSPFQAEIYFINLAKIIQTRYAVPFFDVFDPRLSDYSVPVAVRGTVSYRISDYREFIKLHRLENFSIVDFYRQVKDAVSLYVKNIVANIPKSYNIPVVQIETKISLINDLLKKDIAARFEENFGVLVSGVDISVIELDKTSDGYKELSSVTKDVTMATVQAQKEATVKNIYDMQRINAENYEESLRIQREEGQYAQHLQTQSANLEAYQIGTQSEVGIAGANALGQMGANGAGSINVGDGGATGFNPAAMMTGIAMGGVMANNISGVMQNAMSGINQAPLSGNTPPPIPETLYNIASDGQSKGPFKKSELIQMAQAGSISGKTLVWKPGMTSWSEIETVDELKDVINAIPPKPPV